MPLDQAAGDRLPVVVLTGFLGAGKTTLLNRVLAASPEVPTLVLINEYGREGIDHHLVSELSSEQILLPAGCVCCVLRSDLVEALGDALAKRQRGELPPFERVILETTGVADPTPIVSTLSAAGPLSPWFRLARVVTCVDVGLIQEHLETCEEAFLQLAVADVVIATKIDQARASRVVDAALARVASVNPLALTLGADAADEILASLFQAPTGVHARGGLAEPAIAPGPARAGHGYQSHVFELTRTIRWRVFRSWLGVFTQLASDRILRVKGILYVDDAMHPVVVQAVKHVVYPREGLPHYEDPRRRSVVVLIGRGLDELYLRTVDAALGTTQVPSPSHDHV